MFTEVATLNDLAGVVNSFATLTDGQVLTYDTTNGWQNETPASGVTDHTLLTNIGTNTHAQIDTHLGLTNEHIDWTSTASNLVTTGTATADTVYAGNPTLTVDNTFYLGASSATIPVIQFDVNDNLSYNRTGNNFSFSIGGFGVFSLSATTADFQDLAVTTTGDITANNLSGTNTGDQTSIVGISGTTAEFNTALSDGSFATGGGTATGTNTGDQTITLTGDVTGSGTGSFAATIANSAVTLAKMANVATGTVFYRKTAATGVPEVQTLATLKTDLSIKMPFAIAASDETTALTTGTSKATFIAPWAMTILNIVASVTTAPTGASLVADVNKNGTSIMTTNKLTIEATETSTLTATTGPTLTTTALAAGDILTVDIDQVGSTVAGAGLKVYLEVQSA